MGTRFTSFPALLGLLLVSFAGCVAPERPRDEQLAKGCIFMLPGIESDDWWLTAPVRGLRDAGVDQAIDIIEWGDHPFGSLSNLVSYDKNCQRAACIARRIADYRDRYAGRPVTLIGYSGGGGLAVLVAERLPEGVRLDQLILVATALSPTYDLRPACEHCQNGLVSFYSERDWFVLGLGTRVFGTIDRKKTVAAGRFGFDAHHVPDEVTQVAWKPEWSRLGNDGGHASWLAREWSREVLAKYVWSLLDAQPSGRGE